jgi:hypothetical protein
MSGDGSTTIMRALAVNDKLTPGTNPIVRRIILERFLWVRQHTAERVSEKWTANHVNITTMTNFDTEANLICEDVFVESRPALG